MIIGVIDSTINTQWRVGAAMHFCIWWVNVNFFCVLKAYVKWIEENLRHVLFIQVINGDTFFLHSCMLKMFGKKRLVSYNGIKTPSNCLIMVITSKVRSVYLGNTFLMRVTLFQVFQFIFQIEIYQVLS